MEIKPILLKDLYALIEKMEDNGAKPKYIYFVGDKLFVTEKKVRQSK